ncbi:MAG: class I SAM-dependent RNA methyltransferase [Mycoplasmataceae bacterium]|nr:class I SAM-dependent RNA methyltransferase [Mycoplasmataceae bacterium]
MGSRRRNKKRFPRRYCTVDFYECKKLNERGKGVVLFRNKVFYVDELLPGEKAILLVYFEDQEHGEARAIKLENESNDRVLPLGHPKFDLGSYQIPHMSDAAQDEFKQNRVNNTFGYNSKKIIVGQRSNYRNKVVLHDGGFYPPGKGRRYSVIPNKEQFDLMDLDFDKYKDTKGDLIIRRLDEEIVGKPGEQLFTTQTVLGKKFTINLNSFYQVNDEMALKAYNHILENINEGDVVYDLFGGAATIGIIVSDKASKVYSVEINKNSHDDAVKNIETNKADNVEAILGDANAWVRNNSKKADVVIFDPSRSGLSEESVASINDSGVNKIIYLSCNIETQARDIAGFKNYNIVEMQPYDFFPQTFHIENLIILEKKV